MVGHCYGLSAEETKDLWVQADIDGNGVLDFEEFQVDCSQPKFLSLINLLSEVLEHLTRLEFCSLSCKLVCILWLKKHVLMLSSSYCLILSGIMTLPYSKTVIFMFSTMALQQRIWNPTGTEQGDEHGNEVQDNGSKDSKHQTIGFSIKNAVLFPPEVEKGRWPDDYSLSDHARLTVVFSPIRMPCSQLIS